MYSNYLNNKNTWGGGIALYLHDRYQSRVINNLTFQLSHIESLFLEVNQPHKFIVGIIYRPPNSNPDDFLVS